MALGSKALPSKNISSLWPFKSYKENKVFVNTAFVFQFVCWVNNDLAPTSGTVFTTLHFLRNLQMDPMC